MKKNIFIVVRKLVKSGGLSNYVYSTYTKLMDKAPEGVQIHFVIEDYQNDYINELKKTKIKVHYIHPFTHNPFAFIKDWNDLFKINQIDIIHFHIDNLVLFYPIWKAKKQRIREVIIQSHNSFNKDVENSLVKRTLNEFAKRHVQDWATNLLAVSDQAGEWLYGKKTRFTVIKNPVDLTSFFYSDKLRNEYRIKLGITSEFTLIGHVGRLTEQKNQFFLLKVFKKYLENHSKSLLILIGDGEEKSNIEKKIKLLGIQDSVKLLGRRTDVNGFLNAMDCMVFPSLYEGLPLTLLEAQATGLPIVYSSTITSDIEILTTTRSLELNTSTEKWAAKINSLVNKVDRSKAKQKVVNSGYDYKSLLATLIDLYEIKR
ncbi:glycosyltransferase [Lactobacillus sp. 3B(2020)]|uniref:glycosyltransferase n=1 Tax=Lactobacillus sp. 3B(2020) TaxID=2695882 RepID=UPI0015E037F1|nr:glycosyltransferase [Lactobacillus sp. 3B(2020)]QLL70090.1 glycosyltransferase [Lactobacillus sp. 3B(2020)]